MPGLCLPDVPDITGEADIVVTAPDDFCIDVVPIVIDGELKEFYVQIRTFRHAVEIFQRQIGVHIFRI